MPTTLLVTYTPRGERSNTKKLVEHFRSVAGGEIVELDLLKDVPDYFLASNLSAYYKRNYAGEKLTEAEKKAIAKMDRMTLQFTQADIVVMAYPMYNFSVPAMVKAYYDSVMLKGKTWDFDPNTMFKGLMAGKKALILSTSGGVYEDSMASFDHASTLSTAEFTFMGFSDVKAVNAGGVNNPSFNAQDILAKAKAQITAIANEWYGYRPT
ncbi:TPA: hypothetical protein HA361_03405 [Candidatus Woesearchaeota archaeon]|nr:hypothetical protein [Candidatus Woesearchaeota archaeon]HII69327.1 hypothetical protein [Candidatus Woesearchaeota archaeon]